MPIMLCDSNYLENPALREYLADSRANKLAISEHVLIEQHKTEPETTLRLSFKIAREFPEQILVLKSMIGIYNRPIRTGKDVAALIDRKQSKAFAKWYDDVVSHENHSGIQEHLQQRQQDSLQQIEQIKGEVHDLETTFKKMRDEFTKDELLEIRSRRLNSIVTQDKLINMMARISTSLFKRLNTDTASRPSGIHEAPHYYLFRYAMVVVHFFFRFVDAGNLSPQPEKLVNHVIDLQLVAEASYFNGILSDDKVIREIYPTTRWLLRIMRGYMMT